MLKRFLSARVAQVLLEHWVYKFGPPKALLEENGNHSTSIKFPKVNLNFSGVLLC